MKFSLIIIIIFICCVDENDCGGDGFIEYSDNSFILSSISNSFVSSIVDSQSSSSDIDSIIINYQSKINTIENQLINAENNVTNITLDALSNINDLFAQIKEIPNSDEFLNILVNASIILSNQLNGLVDPLVITLPRAVIPSLVNCENVDLKITSTQNQIANQLQEIQNDTINIINIDSIINDLNSLKANSSLFTPQIIEIVDNLIAQCTNLLSTKETILQSYQLTLTNLNDLENVYESFKMDYCLVSSSSDVSTSSLEEFSSSEIEASSSSTKFVIGLPRSSSSSLQAVSSSESSLVSSSSSLIDFSSSGYSSSSHKPSPNYGRNRKILKKKQKSLKF